MACGKLLRNETFNMHTHAHTACQYTHAHTQFVCCLSASRDYSCIPQKLSASQHVQSNARCRNYMRNYREYSRRRLEGGTLVGGACSEQPGGQCTPTYKKVSCLEAPSPPRLLFRTCPNDASMRAFSQYAISPLLRDDQTACITCRGRAAFGFWRCNLQRRGECSVMPCSRTDPGRAARGDQR